MHASRCCRARELHDVWAALGARAASEEQRLAALAAARRAAQGSGAAAARELVALADREADLLSRCPLPALLHTCTSTHTYVIG